MGIFAGNGAFVNGANTFTGYDGTSSDVNVVVFFNQAEDADGNLDNSTCWDAAVSCADSGAPYFMENVNDHRNAKNGNYNIQIANVNNGDVLSIQLNDNDGNAYASKTSQPPSVLSQPLRTTGVTNTLTMVHSPSPSVMPFSVNFSRSLLSNNPVTLVSSQCGHQPSLTKSNT